MLTSFRIIRVNLFTLRSPQWFRVGDGVGIRLRNSLGHSDRPVRHAGKTVLSLPSRMLNRF